MDRRYRAKEKFRAGWIRARQLRMVQRTGFGRVQCGERRIVGNGKIWVVAEPLYATIPNKAVDVIIYTRLLPQKQNMPYASQCEPNNNDALRKVWRTE